MSIGQNFGLIFYEISKIIIIGQTSDKIYQFFENLHSSKFWKKFLKKTYQLLKKLQ